MLRAINNRNPEPNARDWMMTFLGCIGFPSSIASRRERSESKPKTHHWDPTAEEWIPNDPRSAGPLQQ